MADISGDANDVAFVSDRDAAVVERGILMSPTRDLGRTTSQDRRYAIIGIQVCRILAEWRVTAAAVDDACITNIIGRIRCKR